MRRRGRRAAVVAVAAGLVAGACSSGGARSSSGRGATTAAVTTTTVGGRPSVPTVATTAIPGAATPVAPAGGTSAPVPTTTIPLTPPTGAAPAATTPDAGATTPAAPDTTAPAPTAAPTSAPSAPTNVSGDPGAFCRAVDAVLPLYLATLLLVDSGDGSDGDTKFEVAVAPAVAAPVHAAAANAPAVVAAPFQRWAARADAAVAALETAGATDAQVAALGAAFTSQVDQAMNGGGNQTPPDPVQAAAKAGINGSRLTAATSTFTAANGDFDTFAGALGQDLNLPPSQVDQLSGQYPCASDLASFSG